MSSRDAVRSPEWSESTIMLVNARTVRIQWGDCDPLGIVFFPRYFALFDDSTAALFERALGITTFTLLKQEQFSGFPTVDVRARFLAPSTFGDDVVIESTVREFRRSSFDVQHRLMKHGALAVEGFETRVWVSRGSDARLAAVPIPENIRASFAAR
jgi:4-hydroxybenzoyl-CoA thioesterase